MGSTFQNVCQDSINEEVSGLSNALSGAISIIDNTWFRTDAQNRRENEGGDLAFSTASQANLLAMVCHMYPSAPGDR